jgi:hypothetical protein
MEVAAGLEPAKAGFADQCLDRFGIATCENPVVQDILCMSYQMSLAVESKGTNDHAERKDLSQG